MRKILFVVQQFRQGWGGAPESVRLMANLLAPHGFSSDVFDLGRFHREIERLDLLPEPGGDPPPFPLERVPGYDAILIAGPWQNPARLRTVINERAPGQPFFYLPRGGLSRVDFARPRDLKKWPYFYLIERRLLDRSDAVIFSSTRERDNTIGGARERATELIIPDFFNAAPFAAPETAPIEPDRPVTFSFLAEISPLKGLLPLVEAFIAWSSKPKLGRSVRLRVGGHVRPGSEAYLGRIHDLHRSGPADVSIEFLGTVPHSARQEFYSSTDVFVIPSRGESFGLTLCEALSSGCAVVACPGVGALEYFPGHERLVVTDGEDAHHIEAGLDRILQSLSGDAGGRARTGAYAAEAIAALNSRALLSWTELLTPAR